MNVINNHYTFSGNALTNDGGRKSSALGICCQIQT